MSAPLYDGFLPGEHQIEGYRSGGFHFAGMSHRGSILALPSGIYAWTVTSMEALDPQSIAKVLQEPAGAVEMLLVGTGANLQPLPREVRAALNAAGIRADVMATHHAVPTYNLLLGERRRVGAALIAAAG
jgi:uncharacterized protein